MENEKRTFYPEITISNKSEVKMMEVDGEEVEAKLPPKEGFNIKTRDSENKYETKYFEKEFDGVILATKYFMQSKYGSKSSFITNEFEFQMGKDTVSAYSFDDKRSIFKGTYNEAKETFSSGDEKLYDVYASVYVDYGATGQILKFKWKLNNNCNLFKYQAENKETGLFPFITKFKLSKKVNGDVTFWIATAENGVDVDPEKEEKLYAELHKDLSRFDKKEEVKEVKEVQEVKSVEEEEIQIDKIPF